MSASQYRSQLERKRTQRVDAERRAGEYRIKESKKRADAAKAAEAARKTKSSSTATTKLNEAARREREAAAAGKDANQWQTRASNYAKEEAAIASRLARAERAEADAAERDRKRAEQKLQRDLLAARTAQQARPVLTPGFVEQVARQLRPAKPENLRVLILGASADGELRVGREQKRIRGAVESALHRDRVELDVRPAATAQDLLDGITKFRPHVVHFSGHSNTDLIVFEDEKDEPHEGVIVTAGAFSRAIRATDEPPLLVLLNACHSAAQIDDLVAEGVPFAIGMSDEIGDTDAINYAAQFYASVANGQSINSSHLAGQAFLELAGLDGADLPTLAHAPDVDPSTTVLVKPAPS